MRLLAAVTTDMGRSRLAEGSTMSTLRDWTTLLVDMLQRSISMLAIADSMSSHTCLAGILFAFDQHPDFDLGLRLAGTELRMGGVDDRKRSTSHKKLSTFKM